MLTKREKELQKLSFRGKECRNCGAILDIEDRYCHHCGQKNDTKKLSLKDYLREFFTSVFSYDSRIWTTVKHLLFKPGRVPKEYINGKRTRYANPFRFYFTVSILFFLMIQLTLSFNGIPEETTVDDDGAETTEIAGGMVKVKIEEGSPEKQSEDSTREQPPTPYVYEGQDTTNGEGNTSQENKKVSEASTPDKTEDKEERNYTLEATAEGDTIKVPKDASPMKRKMLLDGMRSGVDYYSEKELDNMFVGNEYIKKAELYVEFIDKKNNYEFEDCMAYYDHPTSSFNKFVHSRSITYARFSHDTGAVIDVFLPKIPLFVFFFIPFFSLFNWLIYARHTYNYIEHIIFNFSIFIFLFLGLIPLTIIDELFAAEYLSSIFLALVAPFYLYMAMRKFYGQSRAKTIFKFILVHIAFGVFSILSIAFFTLLGLLIT